jgi:PKD repeat protein
MTSLVAACNLIPKNFKIETTSELGPDTLSRIDEINAMLEKGIEIGPETRSSIESLNDTIADGVKFGFTEDTLNRVDNLLGIVEQGVGIKLGLDAETNASVNHLISTLEEAPDQWENTMTEIIQVLETSSSSVASNIADEVSTLMDEARLNTQYVAASVGLEFRCNVDFLSARAGETVDQFIGRSLIGRLRTIVSGEDYQEAVSNPWVCQIIPDQIDLEEISGGFVFQNAVIKISGYNYNSSNLPKAYIVDEAGQLIESAILYPFLTSPYQIQLNLQGIDFSTIPERSRVVFSWPNSGANYALSVVFPAQKAQEPEIPVAKLVIIGTNIGIYKGPDTHYHLLGRADQGAEYEVIGRNGDGSWWQIDYDGNKGWVSKDFVTRNEIEVPVASIPLPPPTGSFEMSPNSGEAPLIVNFADTSTGQPYRWTWDFGDGLPVYTKEASYQYTKAGTYQVTLTVENDFGIGTITKEIVVDRPPFALFPLLPNIEIQRAPLATATVSNPSFPKGSVVFQNFTNLKSPVHFNTTIRSDVYDCGIVGMAAMNGRMLVKNTGTIFYANMVAEGNSWWIHTDFRSPSAVEENWSVAIMCIMKNYSDYYQVFRRVHVDPGVSDTIDLGNLGINPSSSCGVIGMAAWWGDINEHGQAQYITKTYVDNHPGTGNWELTANFNTHGDHEEVWDVDILCVQDIPSVFKTVQLQSLNGGLAHDTGISSAQYFCGITGMAALYGEIAVYERSDIIQVYPFIGANGNWFVQTDFITIQPQEQWDIDLLCVNTSATVSSGNWNTGWVP